MRKSAMTLDQFATRLEPLIEQLMRGILQHEKNALTRGLITLPQFEALACIHTHPGCSMHELARGMDLGFSSATGLTDRLVRLALVERTRHEQDRRVVRVRLTARGRQILRRIYSERAASIRRLFGPLTARERDEYLTIIEKLAAQLSPESDR